MFIIASVRAEKLNRAKIMGGKKARVKGANLRCSWT